MNRSDTLGISNAGSLGIRRTVVGAALVALALGAAVTPGVRGRVMHAFSNLHRGTSYPAPRFSDPPTDDDFLRTGLFAQPLIPVGPTNREENEELAALLTTYADAMHGGARDAVQPLVDFTSRHPRSAWTPGLQLDLGAVYRSTGHYSKALTTWQASWDASRSLTSADGRIVADTTGAYLSQFEAYLGRKELLAPLLHELEARPVRGSAAELISESELGLSEMELRPEVSFKCGPAALARILRQDPTRDVPASRRVLLAAKSTPNGLSLSAVRAVSVEAGMSYQMAFRSPGASLIVPAVAHWKVGHYAAILGRGAHEQLAIGDATFGEDIVMAQSTFDEESSGYFLVSPGPLPAGWRSVSEEEGKTVWGRGNTGDNHDKGATGRPEVQAFPPGKCGGCTTWNVEAAVVGLELRDDPVGYEPPFGPAIRFPMTYSHRDLEQPMTFTYTNFGNRWTFDWLSYVTDNANDFNGSAIVGESNGQLIIGTPANCLTAEIYRRGGGDESYLYPSTCSGAGSSQPLTTTLVSGESEFSQTHLTRNVANGSSVPTSFTRTFPDGSVEQFGFSQDGKHFFMTEVDDPQGNAVKIVYDSATARIMNVVDAAGQKSTLCYSDSKAPPCAVRSAPSNLQVTQIVDPFGRSATFDYDAASGHLIAITDVLGIQSSYQYDTDKSFSENTDFITTMKTPYGTTTFAFADPTTEHLGTWRTLAATETPTSGDTSPRTSYVEFRQGSGGDDGETCTTVTTPLNGGTIPAGSSIDPQFFIQCTDGNLPQDWPVPNTNILLHNGNLQFRNTFVFNPEQYVQYQLAKYPYLEGKIIHWLHTDSDPSTNGLIASRIPESIKEPLEERVWFTYPDQTSNLFTGANNVNSTIGVGATNQPTDVVRAVGDGTTFQHWQYQYDTYGHVTKSVDPIGRTLSMTYDQTNNVDLLSVTNTTPGHSVDPLLTLSSYVQHRPQQVTGASGQATRLTYNAAGQLLTSTTPDNATWTNTYAPSSTMTLQAGCTGTSNCGLLTKTVGPSVAVPASQGGGVQTPIFSFTYDGVGRTQTEVGPDQQSLTFSYDAADRLTQTLFPDETTEQRGYTAPGPPGQPAQILLDLTSFKDRMGNTTGRTYDGFRELVEIDEPAGRITKLAYSLDGELQTVTDPLGHVTTYGRDLEDRLTSITYADATTEYYAYDLLGRLTSKSPDTAAAMPGTVKYAYNVDDTVSHALLDSRAPTVFTYDAAYRRVTAWSRIQGATWAQPTCASGSCKVLDGESYTYVGAGLNGANKLSVVSTASTPWPYTATAPTAILDTSYSYDALDRVTGRGFNAANKGGGQEALTYDQLGRLTKDVNLLDSFSYTYGDATARVTGRTSNAGPQVAASYLTPQQDGLLAQLTYTTRAGALLAQYGYGYDDLHNVTTFSDSNAGTAWYAYDAYSQLRTAALPGSTTFTATPDAAGNLGLLTTALPPFMKQPGTTTSVTYSYDSGNKMFQEVTAQTGGLVRVLPVTQAVSTDSSVGSLDAIGTGGVAYQYDGGNRLFYETDGAASSNFYYDGLGRLSQVVDSTTTTTSGVNANHSYVWCGGKMCLEIDNTRLVRGRNGLQDGTPDAIYFAQGAVNNPSLTTPPASQLAYDVTDLLGSERAVVTNDAIVALYTYDTFGNRSLVSGNVAASNRGFTGFYFHLPSGLQFAKNRVYNSSLGRWLTRDPIGIGHAFDDPARFNATDLNLYAYAGNNPQSMVDPSGNNPFVIGAAWAFGALDTAAIGAGALAAAPFVAIGAAGLAGKAGIDAYFANLAQQQGTITGIPDAHPPKEGNPGDTVVGSKQSRRYGPDGLPETDVDTGHDHGQGDPHVHDWGRNPNGSCDGQRGPGRAPGPGDPPAPPGYGNPNPFMTPTP